MVAEAPEQLLIPMKWNVVTLWTRGDESFEIPVAMEQQTIVRAGGKDVFKAIVPFEVSNDHSNFRNTIAFTAFPLFGNNKVTIEIYLRNQGQGEWVKRFDFPLLVERSILEVPNDDKAEVRSESDHGESIA